MNTHSPDRSRRRRQRRGSTIILTMIFLALFATLAVAFCAGSNMNLQQAKNYRDGQLAQLAAESGLAFMINRFGGLSIPVSEAKEDLLVAVANHMANAMDDTPNMGAGEITFDGSTVRTPSIELQPGQTFRAEVNEDAFGNVWLHVYGTWGGFTRHITMQMEKINDETVIFDFGLASKGKIVVDGEGTVVGVNDPSEANIFSATYSDPEAIRVGGNCNVAGDIFTANPDSFVTVEGSATVAGTENLIDIIDHIHVGAGDPAFPEVDTSPFIPFAYNTLDKNADTSGDMILENVRVPAGMNPTFDGKVQMRGVIYIEQPNKVTFAGQATLNGMIVTDDAGDNSYTNNTLTFEGSLTAAGVESLPDLPQFAELKNLEGTSILAPGFGVTFAGNFDSINGAIAADQFVISGNSTGTVKGPIICYGDTEFALTGGGTVNIDRSSYGDVPAGFVLPYTFIPVPETYEEVR